MSIKITPINTGPEVAAVFVFIPADGYIRKTDFSIRITINPDGKINIPMTGDLHPEHEMPEFINALAYAREIAVGSLEIEGVEIDSGAAIPTSWDGIRDAKISEN